MRSFPLLLSFLALALSAAQSQPLCRLVLRTNAVACYAPLEFEIDLAQSYTNAFDPDEVALDLEINGPTGLREVVPAFFMQPFSRATRGKDWLYPEGNACWRARYAPRSEGTYTARIKVTEPGRIYESATVTFKCLPASPTTHGYLQVSRRDPRFLEFTDGSPFFAIGQNLAFIGNQQHVNLAAAERIFQRLSAAGANYLRVWTSCEDWALAIEARKSAFGRSWNWNPPLGPAPAGALGGGQCLVLPPSKPRLNVEPSHPVALRSETGYEFGLRWRSQTTNDLLRVGMRGQKLEARATHEGWQEFKHVFQTAPGDYWLGAIELEARSKAEVHVELLSLREASGGPELLWEATLNRPVRNYYNQPDCFMLDQLVEWARAHGIYLQLCMLARDLYMGALKDPASPAYDQAVRDARKFFRYAIARWGYATSVAAWEYWNEQDPGLPTDRFYEELGRFFDQTDVNRHLRTTSTWGPSPKDCQHPQLDVADVHFYLRPVDRPRLPNEVDAILDRAAWLRAQAPARPAQLGEFGLADDKWAITPELKQGKSVRDLHNALWASALSGLSGTALFWWWERLDERDAYSLYGPISRFTRQIPWNSGEIQPLTIDGDRLRAQGLRTSSQAWFWLFDRSAAWPALESDLVETPPVRLRLPEFTSGTYRVCWWDTREGRVTREDQVTAGAEGLSLNAPAFRGDQACAVERN